MSKKNSKMLLTAGFMAFATFAAKALGLIRDSLIAANFGTGIEADAFMSASKLPTTLFDVVIGGVISATFIPIFNDILTKEGKKDADAFASKFITMIILVTVIISAAGVVFSEQIVSLLTDFEPATHELTVRLTAIMFPMIIFTGIAFSFVGILQSYGEYNIPSIISLVSNLAIILYFILFGGKFGVTGLAVTMIIAWSLQVAVQIPSLVKLKFRYRPNIHFKDRHLFNAMLLAVPMLISTWAQPLFTLINQKFASGISGAYASLELANRLYIIITGVFSFVVTNLVFPKLAQANAGDNRDEANELIMTSLKAIIIVIAPLMAGMIILSRPITAIIYEHGSFTSTDIVSNALSCYCVGMLFLAVNEVLSKAFFSMKNSVTPMVTAIISMVFDLLFVLSAYRFVCDDPIRLTGTLALAAAAGSAVNALLNAFMLFKKCPGMVKRGDVISIIKVLLSAGIMAVAVRFIYGIICERFSGFGGNIMICVICGAAGVAVYAALTLLLRVKEITDIIKR